MMSKLEELIAKLCPNGVEFIELENVAEIGTGSRNGNEAVEGGMYPFFVRSQFIKALNSYDYDDEAVIIPGEGGIGDIFHYVNGKYALHQRVYRIHLICENINGKFLYYYMKANFKKFILKKAVSATVTSIRKPMIQKFKIPVPLLEVQREIVRILDDFTLYQNELAAELAARKKQYEYYNRLLLTTINEINESIELNDVADIYDSLHKTPQYIENGIPMIRVMDVKSGYIDTSKSLMVSESDYDVFTKKYCPQFNDIIVSRVGSYGNFALIGNEKCCLGQNISLIHPKINAKYLYYYLRSDNVKNFIESNVNGASHKSLTLNDIKRIPVKVPSNTVQQRIADILDRFDKLCNDISEGLPAEIEMRRKQYEYYRDKLLTFKAKEA